MLLIERVVVLDASALLTVEAAYDEDQWKAIARVPPRIAEFLGLSLDDVVEIHGKHRHSVARYVPLRDDEKDRDIIRIDKVVLSNAGGTRFGDKVPISKIAATDAKKVVLRSLGPIPPDVNILEHISKFIDGVPLQRGDNHCSPSELPYRWNYGLPFGFQAIEIVPSGIVKVRIGQTEVVVLEQQKRPDFNPKTER